MIGFKTLGGGTALTAIFMTCSAAFADVTPRQVWDDWKDYLEAFGYTIDATETPYGNDLTLSDITANVTLPEDEGTVTFTMSDLTLRENGDGSVSITFPPSFPVTMRIASKTGEDVDFRLDYTSTGMAMNVSGDPDKMTYTYSAASFGAALAELNVNGENVDFGEARVDMRNMTGTSTMEIGDLRNSSQTFSTGETSYALDFTDPETGGRVMMQGTVDQMRFDGTGSFPAIGDMSDMSEMLAAGFAVDGTFSYGRGASTFDFNQEGETVQGQSTSENGNFTVRMDETQLRYATGSRNVRFTMAGGAFPFPVEFAVGEANVDLQMPLTKSDEEQDFAFAITLRDFEISDMIWGIFDPAAALPRDPATIVLDLSGRTRMLVDFLDPEQLEQLDNSASAPAELNALNVNNLTLRAVGTELTGNGGFTFDNSDLESFDGLPAPTGAVDLKLVGGNGLLDRLVGMGLMPEDQATGMRMMMGLFAVPGAGEDTMTSRIEVTEDGQVLANGQRLK